ncbi:unnamed protein product [Anisakis simplex]|uniref:Uncharacterized protein n=1 Tax=Anisakis simplex TaxID=6269 RepID=A0A3P6P1H8_ANISI|nr:unnamed protein product [Anisakis simplex]
MEEVRVGLVPPVALVKLQLLQMIRVLSKIP